MKKMRINGFKYRFPFQEGIIIACKSLQGLYTYLQEKYQIEYILTNHLCQGFIENFFSVQIKYRLRSYTLGKHASAIFVDGKNTQEREQSNLLIQPQTLISNANKDSSSSNSNSSISNNSNRSSSSNRSGGVGNNRYDELLSDVVFNEIQNPLPLQEFQETKRELQQT